MPTILFIDHAQGLGGAENLLLLILKHLDRNRFQPHLFCAPGPLADATLALGVPVHLLEMPRLRRSPRFPWDWQGVMRAIARLATDIDAALLHANTVRAALYAAPAARLAKRPFLWHMHDFWLSETEPANPAFDRRGKQMLCGFSQQVIAISRSVADHLPCPERTTVIHNGIESDRFGQGDGGAFRRSFGIPPDVPVVGMVGRLRPWKGQATFLRTAARLHENHPRARFLIVGGDPFQVDDRYALDLRRRADSLGLERAVTFTGQLDDVGPALAAMDVFVHPGAPEPFGLVVIEAMATARPVVAFAHGALPEIVVDGQTGLLVPPNDEEALALAVSKLLDDRSLLRAMGEAGRVRCRQHFDIASTVSAVQDVYEGVME